MNRLASSFAWLGWGAMLAAAIITGCHHETTSAVPKASNSKIGKHTPEESFRIIVDTFKRGIEDIQASFIEPEAGGGGHTMLIASNKVSDEIIPPTKEDEPYRATITVTSRSRYSLQRDADAEEAKARDEEKKKQEAERKNSADSAAADTGVDILDPDLVSTSSKNKTRRSSPTAPDNPVTRQEDTSDRTYDLVYENGRWALVTKLDAETEQAVQNAFNHALETQP